MNRSFSIALWLVAVGVFFFLTACKDDPTSGSTRVEGQVVQRQSRQPVGNGTVQVWLASKGGENT